MNDFYVYSYSSKKDGLFWIGKGRGRRIKASHQRCPYCYRVLEARKKENINVKREKIFDGLSEKVAFQWEKILIWFHEPKCNLTGGGDGPSGYKHSEESKRKMSRATKGKIFSEEHRLNISKALKDRKLSKEHCRNISEAQIGTKHSEESKRKMSEARKNRPQNWKLSEEHKKNISETLKAYWARKKSTQAELFIPEEQTNEN